MRKRGLDQKVYWGEPVHILQQHDIDHACECKGHHNQCMCFWQNNITLSGQLIPDNKLTMKPQQLVLKSYNSTKTSVLCGQQRRIDISRQVA